MSVDRLISFWGIGAGSDTSRRRMQWVTPEGGWPAFVATHLVPQMKLGIRRFLLWMPFGQDELRQQTVGGVTFETRVRFDQYLLARSRGPAWMTDRFAESIAYITREGCQVIAYCGTLPGAPEYEHERWYRDEWIDACLQPFKRGNCDLALDTIVRSPPGHYGTRLVRELRCRHPGLKVYAESMPLAAQPHWAQGDVISVEAQYQHAASPANRQTLVDPAKIIGELVRMLTDRPAGGNGWRPWYRAAVPRVLGDGHTACVYLQHYLAEHGTLEELVG